MKAEFQLVLYDDEKTRRKLKMMGTLEAAFDDERNSLPDEYYWFSDHMPLGSRIRVTLELLPLCAETSENADSVCDSARNAMAAGS